MSNDIDTSDLDLFPTRCAGDAVYYILSGEGSSGTWERLTCDAATLTATLISERASGVRWARAVGDIYELAEGWAGIDYESGDVVPLPDFIVRGIDAEAAVSDLENVMPQVKTYSCNQDYDSIVDMFRAIFNDFDEDILANATDDAWHLAREDSSGTAALVALVERTLANTDDDLTDLGMRNIPTG